MIPTKTKKAWTIAELNQMYTDGDTVDQAIFAEMRSNLLLYSGEHYSRKNSSFYKRVRDAKDLTQEQKLRLTKNHIQFICDSYVNNIVAPNPGVGFRPKNDNELHDQKVADLHHAVWRDAHERYDIDDKIDDWADSFVQIGEVAVKIYFNPSLGPIKAYNQEVDGDGNPLFVNGYGKTTEQVDQATGQPNEPSQDFKDPIHAGEFCFDEIYGFNLLRPSECKDLRKSPWLGERKMVACDDLIAQFPDKANLIQPEMDKTYQVFNTTAGGYSSTHQQALVTEFYVRPCPMYPEGHFFITTKAGILHEDDLPGGIFPIVFQPFRKFATSPRGVAPIRTMRPYQAEINRSASKTAEHQITLGDDKIILTNGSKTSAGISLPGMRTVNVTGQAPVVLPGRDGSQYFAYEQATITELYKVMGVAEYAEDIPGQLDPLIMLYRASREKKRFQRFSKRFEKFLINIVKTYQGLAKIHLPDDYLIFAVGKSEQVNIPEFRQLSDICLEIKVEAQSEDAETKAGNQLACQTTLQYVGGRLKPDQMGRVLRAMPYGNFKEGFEDLTQDYDRLTNEILALDRGEQPPVNAYDDHTYTIGRLTFRMTRSDFNYLPPQVKQNYAAKIQLHEQFQAQKLLSMQRAQQGLIPTGGYLSKCDLYVPDPSNPNKQPQRVSLPAESLQWLISQLQAQQSGLAPLADLPTGAQGEIADKFMGMGGGQQAAPGASPQTTINQAWGQTGATAAPPRF